MTVDAHDPRSGEASYAGTGSTAGMNNNSTGNYDGTPKGEESPSQSNRDFSSDWGDNDDNDDHDHVSSSPSQHDETRVSRRGPMHGLTRGANIPKSPDFHDPRHNENLYSGTGTRDPDSYMTDTIKSIDDNYRAGKVDVGIPD